MQKAFGWIERILVCFTLIGLFLSLSLMTGGATLLLIGLAFISMLYFAGGYFQPAQPGPALSTGRVILKILSGLALSTLVVGAQFKLLFWSGAGVMLATGLVLSLTAVVAAWLLNKPDQDLTGVVRRGTLWSVAGLLLFFISSTSLFGVMHRNDPVLVEKFSAMTAHPNDSHYRDDYSAYQRQQHSQKTAQQ